MRSVRIAELKAHLSEHLRAVEAGETVVVLDRTTPIARIVPMSAEEPALVIRPAQGSLADLPSLPPLPGVDILEALREERADRW